MLGRDTRAFSFDAGGAGGRGWQFIERPPCSLMPTSLYKAFDDSKKKKNDEQHRQSSHKQGAPPGGRAFSFFF